MKKICLLLANGFEMSEASVFTDVMGWNQAEGNGETDMHLELHCDPGNAALRIKNR